MRLHKVLTNGNEIDCQSVSAANYSREEDRLTFKIVFNGEQHFKLSKKEVMLFPDGLICLHPGTHYETTINTNEPVKTLSVSISSRFLSDFKNSYLKDDEQLLAFNESKIELRDQFIHPLCNDMHFNIQHMYRRLIEKESSELLINEYLNQCLRIYYANTWQEINKKLQNLNFARTATKLEILKRLNLAKEFMSNNYNRKFGLEEIAGVACLSPNHLLRTFKQAFGLSPYQYLSSIRLQRAKILLETGQYSVNDVVLQVGFESTSTFIKFFKANFGLTPLKYSKAKSIQFN